MVAQVRQSNPYAIEIEKFVSQADLPKPKYKD